MCGTGPKWKREEVADHKFDFVDVEQFASKSFFRKIMYMSVFILVIKSILLNGSDLATAILLLASSGWTSDIKPERPSLLVTKIIFVASIVVSYLLLLVELRKTRRVIRSHDIAYSYTCIGAHRFYSVRSYSYYCLFCKIGDNKRMKNFFAFFCFFALKGWKRFLFAEAPRQVINAFTLYGVYVTNGRFNPSRFWDYPGNINNKLTIALMSFSFVLWAISALKLVLAFFIYMPLLCSIRGNLKEYVCHKIDKRIAALLRSKSRGRILQERKEQAILEAEMRKVHGGADGSLAMGAKRQATLPAVALLDPEADIPLVPALPHAHAHKEPSPYSYASSSGPGSTTMGSGNPYGIATEHTEDQAYPPTRAPTYPHHTAYTEGSGTGTSTYETSRVQAQAYQGAYAADTKEASYPPQEAYYAQDAYPTHQQDVYPPPQHQDVYPPPQHQDVYPPQESYTPYPPQQDAYPPPPPSHSAYTDGGSDHHYPAQGSPAHAQAYPPPRAPASETGHSDAGGQYGMYDAIPHHPNPQLHQPYQAQESYAAPRQEAYHGGYAPPRPGRKDEADGQERYNY